VHRFLANSIVQVIKNCYARFTLAICMLSERSPNRNQICVICVVRILPASKTVVGGFDLVDLTVKCSVGVGR